MADLWNITQTLTWICNVKGRFTSAAEIDELIRLHRSKVGRGEPTMAVGCISMMSLPSVQVEAERGEVGDRIAKLVGSRLNKCWSLAYDELVAAVRIGTLKLIGRPRRTKGKMEILDALACAQVVFRDADEPFATYPESDDFSWDNLRFDPKEILARWPFDPPVNNNKAAGGRPPAADWRALEEALSREIAEVGFPNRDGEPGWQKPADVIRWVEERTGDYEPGKTALKTNVKAMLDRIRQANVEK
jgi:hypothetical protein